MVRNSFELASILVVVLVVGVVVWMNWRYLIVFPALQTAQDTQKAQKAQEEGFEGTGAGAGAGEGTVNQSQVAPMVHTVLDPYMDPRVCKLFMKIRESIIVNNSTSGSAADAESIEKTDKQLALEIPGGPPPCAFPAMPADSADDSVWLAYVNSLPRDILARILFTAEYIQRTLKQKEQQIKGVTATEGFQPLCAPSVADTRRAERKARGAVETADACVNPEELTREQIQNQTQLILQEIQSTSKKTYEAARTSTPFTPTRLSPLLDESEQIIQKLEQVKQQAESNTLPLPKVG
jgi:hypothetical protein